MNSLLKYFAVNRTFYAINLKVYDEQLNRYGHIIFEKRTAFLNEFIPIFKNRYKAISNSSESVDLVYKTQLTDINFLDLLDQNVERDRVLQYTSSGIHKDDLTFEIDGYPIKKFGSQGQQKSYLIALKLAQFDFIKAQSKVKPILLLDDIFDKLDHNRVEHLMKLVSDHAFGQVFITDTDEDRIDKVFKEIDIEQFVFKVEEGQVEKR